MFLNFCKRILFVRTKVFALPYAVTLILLTVLFRWIRLPPSYFSDSKNVFNLYFMKYSYYYVIGFLLPFVVCLNLVYGFGKLKCTIAPLVRLIANFAILYFLSWDFSVIGYMVGVCTTDSGADATTPVPDPIEGTCEFFGYAWKPFDISGHMYHNIYGVLVIMEEAQAYKLWELVELVVDTVIRDKVLWKLVNHIIDEEISVEDKATLLKWYGRLSLYLKVNFCALALVWIGLNIANLLTAVYFHTIVENAIATVAALLFWLLCYRLVFPLYGTHSRTLEAHKDILETKKDEESDALKGSEQKSYRTL